MITDVKMYSWEVAYSLKNEDSSLKTDDVVIAEIDGLLDWGKIEKIKRDNNFSDKISGAVLRKATDSDLETIKHYQKKKTEALEFCRELIKKYNLPMKLINAKFGFDGSRVIFAFTADGRVDFRELVKSLSGHFQKSIRLQQVGSRDQARNLGAFGPCGRELCCRNFQKNNLESISSRAMFLQQLTHRGSERLSGICGRLMCCLNFELAQYEEFKKEMPNISDLVKTPEGKGKITNLFILSKKVEVELENGNKRRFFVKEIKNLK